MFFWRWILINLVVYITYNMMTQRDLKLTLYSLIDGINDKAILEACIILLAKKAQDEGDFWDTLDEETKAAIEEGIADADAGRDTDFFAYMKDTHGIEGKNI